MARSSRGYYRYPLGAGATVGRIDQGQDFGGSGPIRAIGRAQVTKIGAPGWPGGAGILYKLLEGPLRGRYVYVYEGVKPSVRVGQQVAAGQVIGQIVPGSSTGIEMGWADAAGTPMSHSEYTEGKETKSGKSFAGFVSLLSNQMLKGGGVRKGSQAEREKIRKLAGEEGGNSGIPGLEQVEGVEGQLEAHGAGGLAESVISGIVSDLASSAEPLMLNIGLVGGGAFLVYYGVMKMLGVQKPVKKGLEAAAIAAPK